MSVLRTCPFFLNITVMGGSSLVFLVFPTIFGRVVLLVGGGDGCKVYLSWKAALDVDVGVCFLSY